MTSTASAKRTVMLGIGGTAVLGTVGHVRRKGAMPPTRLIVGTFVAGAILAGLAEFAPALAAGLAGLALVTSAFVVGSDAWSGIQAITT